MKIAIVIERFEDWRGGAETSTREIARLLADRGHEVHVLTSSTTVSPPGITVHRIAAANVLRPLRTATFVQNAATFLQAHRFDVVHAVAPLPVADVYQPRGGLVEETIERNIATRRGLSRRLLKRAMAAMNVKQRSLVALERQVFAAGGPLIVAVSEYVARQCARLYGVGTDRVRVVFNGVQPPAVAPDQRESVRRAVRELHHIGPDDLVLLFIAHNFRLKGLGPLIEACGRLARRGTPPFRLVIVGRDNPVRFQKRVVALGIESFVTFTGPTRRIDQYFVAADVCVHPTYYDPCSRVVLESLCHGLPCVTTVFNGAAEAMQHGREGFVLATPDDVEVLADHIQELFSPALRQRMGSHALMLRERLAMFRHVQELEALFMAVAERKRRPICSA